MKRRWLRVALAVGGMCAAPVIALFIVPHVFDGVPRLIEAIFEALDPVIPRRFKPVRMPVVEDPRVMHAQEPRARAKDIRCSSVCFINQDRKIVVLGDLNMEDGYLDRPFVATYDLDSGAFGESVTHWPAGAYGHTLLQHKRSTDMNIYLFLGSLNYYFVYGDEKGIERFHDGERTERRYRKGFNDFEGSFRRRYFYRMPVDGGVLSPWKPLGEFARERLDKEYDCVMPVYECCDEGYVVAQCWQERDAGKEYVLYDVTLEKIVGRVAQSAREAGISGPRPKRFGDHKQFLAVPEWHPRTSVLPERIVRILQLSPVFTEVGIEQVNFVGELNPMQGATPNELLLMDESEYFPEHLTDQGYVMCPIHSVLLECVPGANKVTLTRKKKTYWSTSLCVDRTAWVPRPIAIYDNLLYIDVDVWPGLGDTYGAIVLIEPFPEVPVPDALNVPGRFIGINTDGALLATTRPRGFRIWAIDFPDVREVASCRLAYDPKSQRVVLADNQESSHLRCVREVAPCTETEESRESLEPRLTWLLGVPTTAHGEILGPEELAIPVNVNEE